MKYDCIIIGGGLSGLTCGIKCVKSGLRTAIFSGGMSALYFSSGSIDLLGYSSGHKAVQDPFKQIQILTKSYPEHPYSKISVKLIRESMEFLAEELAIEGLHLCNTGSLNHFRITALGVLKPTYLSQESVYNNELCDYAGRNITIALLNFDGFRDFFPELTISQMKKNKFFNNAKFITGKIKLSFLSKNEKDVLEANSIDIARVFETERYLPRIADEIKKSAGKADIVIMPAFIGLNKYNKIHRRLTQMTGLRIHEIACLPPSILGMRIDNALKSRFSALGGEFIAGDRVTGGEILNGKVDHIHTANYGETRHYSKYFVLSTGSFLSGGLQSSVNTMEEPVFKLQFKPRKNRNKWYSGSFFEKNSHPFLSFGVNTNKYLNPFDKNGDDIDNLYCTGAVLSGYDPVKEGSGGGVAIATAYYTARNILRKINK